MVLGLADEGTDYVRISAATTLLLALVLTGCVQSEFFVLKNPTTGEIVQCHPDSGASLFPIAQTMMDNSAARSCAAGYQAAGWQRMN
jgi:hypothetical protein